MTGCDSQIRWRHVTWGTKRSWLPGDERGFRNRGHRIHSSGDYKHRPPANEHRGLRKGLEAHSDPPVIIPPRLREPMAQRLITFFRDERYPVAAVAVSDMHAHALVALPDDVKAVKAIVGRAKSASSRAVRKQMPGRIWADGCDYRPVDNAPYFGRSRLYIRDKQEPGAWTWADMDVMFGRG